MKKEVKDIRFEKDREVSVLQISLNQLQLELDELKMQNVCLNHSNISHLPIVSIFLSIL